MNVEPLWQSIAEEIWQEGWLKGHSEGALEAVRGMLQDLLTDRFGSLPHAVVWRIECATDLNRLTAAARQVSRMDKLEDLQL